jgi:hypothetical protein
MTRIIQDILSNLIPVVFVSVITAFIAVKLSIRQFYSQKLWEKKTEAYTQIVEQLSYLQFYYTECLNRMSTVNPPESERKAELASSFNHAKEIIAKAFASGAYIISNETSDVLENLLNELYKEDPNRLEIKDFTKCYNKTKECIAVIKGLAKKDLGGK